VGRTLVEDPMVVGEDLAVLDEAAVTETWRWMRRSGHARHGPGGGQ
jgi:hypothetical protein